MLRSDKYLATDLEQDTGQQGRSQGRRNAFDQALKTPGHPTDNHQHGTCDVRTDGLVVTDAT